MGNMGPFHWAAAGLVFAAAAYAAAPAKVTRVRIHKTSHTLELWSTAERIATYPVSLGPGGPGVKRREGDKVTPVGHYKVLARWPSRSFKTFMHLDYPNEEDRARFERLKAEGVLPRGAAMGGAIGIHGGTPEGLNHTEGVANATRDWTLGCIGVEDAEIAEIARRVPDGTPVDIDDD